MDACACNRLWCAEQAVRMGAAQVVIVDGTGFSALAWRRLQLAVDAAGTQSQMRETMHGQTAKPCVLVVTSSPDGRQSAGCAATARWSVGLAAPDSECAMGGDAAFGWRLRLMSARQFGLQGVLAGGTAETQARIDARDRVDQGSAMHSASERGCIDIVMSRSAAGTRADAAWELVGARARMHADRGVLATLVLDNLDAEPTLAAESAMQMACLDGGTQSWRARSA